MHRTIPRPLVWGLFAALVVALVPAMAAAQEKLPLPVGEFSSRSEVLGINQTKRIGMMSKAPIVDIQNENPKVVRIDKVEKDPTTVYVTGLTFGTARLVFTDANKKVETVLIRVDDLEQRRQDLSDLIRKIAPTANLQVDATTAAGPITVILTGNISDIDTAQRVMEAARAIFTIRLQVDANKEMIVPPNVVNGMRIVGVQQVQLEVVVAVVDRSKLRQMNFNFFVNGQHGVFNSTFVSPLAFANSLTTAANAAATLNPNINTPTNISFGIMGTQASFTGFLQALTTEGLTKILADTRVTTLSGRPGRVVSGGEVPILTSSGQGAPSVAYKQFGTVVNFLPIVENGKIHLEVRPELSAINQSNGITIQGVTPTVVPGFSTRQAEVAVQLEDGQTLAIGGLIQNTVNATIQRVPIVGQIPGLSMFFTNKSYNETEEELLIIVTPRLVDGFDCTRIPKYLPGRETRSPDDFELFLEGIMEAPRGPREIVGHLRGYQGAHMNAPNIGQYPCANGGIGGGVGGRNGCSTCAPRGPATSAGWQMPNATSPAMPTAVAPVPLPGELPTAQPLPVGEPTGGFTPVEVPQAVPAPTTNEPRPALPPVNIGPAPERR